MKKSIPYWDVNWTTLEGEPILQVKGSDYAAMPATGKKNARRFIVFNVNERVEITQLLKHEVTTWLITVAQEESVKPTGFI